MNIRLINFPPCSSHKKTPRLRNTSCINRFPAPQGTRTAPYAWLPIRGFASHGRSILPKSPCRYGVDCAFSLSWRYGTRTGSSRVCSPTVCVSCNKAACHGLDSETTRPQERLLLSLRPRQRPDAQDLPRPRSTCGVCRSADRVSAASAPVRSRELADRAGANRCCGFRPP